MGPSLRKLVLKPQPQRLESTLLVSSPMAPRRSHSNSSDIDQARVVTALGVVAPPPIHVESPVFTGSLATLFLCVRDKKIDLLQVPLGPICEAYWEYLKGTEGANVDEAAAALVALAYLTERKAWSLLPGSAPEPEAEDALDATMLPSTGLFLPAIELLRDGHERRLLWYFRSPDATPVADNQWSLGDIKLSDLAGAFQKIIERAVPDPETPKIRARRVLSDVMAEVMACLNQTWRTLDEFFPHSLTRSDVAYWFLALLELIRLGVAALRQNDWRIEISTCRE